MANTTFNGPVRSQNGFESVTTNATTGEISLDASFGKNVVLGTQYLVGGGAVDTTNTLTLLFTTGNPQALTLADGVAGQVKIISKINYAVVGDAVLTPSLTDGSFTTITFANIGDSAILVFSSVVGVGDYGWTIVALNGAVAV